MNPEGNGHSGRLVTGLLGSGLLLLPLVFWPWDLGAADLLPKRLLLYATGAGISALWLKAVGSGALPRVQAPLTLPAAAYVLINLLSLSWAHNRFSGWVEAVQLLVLFILFLGMISLLRPRHILPLAQFSALGGLLVSVVGIAQYLGLGFAWIPSVGMPSGTFVFRNLAAAYLVGNIPLGVIALLLDPVPRRRPLWGMATAAMLLFLVYTRTRGAWIGLAAAVIAAGILLLVYRSILRSLRPVLVETFASSSLRWLTALCAILLLVGIALPERTSRAVIQRFDEQKSTPLTAAASLLTPGSDRGRKAMWKHTLEMIADRPILGVGLDNWEFAYPPYDRGDKITGDSEPVRPHNDFLWIASEIGLLGLGIYIWLLVITARTVVRLSKTGAPEVRITALLCGIGLLALLGHSTFSFLRERPAPSTIFWLYLTVLALLSTFRKPAPRGVRLDWIAPLLGLFISAGACYLNWRHIQFDTQYQRADAHREASEWNAALGEISQALNYGTFDHRAQFLRGRFLHRLGRYPEAENAYRKALLAHPHYAHTYHNLGGVCAAQKKWTRAIAAYQKALDIRPGYDQARIHLGNAYVATGRVEDAFRTFGKIADSSPYAAEACGNLGAIYLQHGALDRAISELQKAVRLRPSYPEAYNNLAYAFEQKGQLREAIAAYGALLKYWKGDREYARTIRTHLETLRRRQKE